MSRFQILSLDGGGIRGVFSAAMLAAIEEDHGICVTDHFDLIAGTSTGGIIAIALGLGLRPREIVEFYVRHGPAIFANRSGWRAARHWFRNKYPGRPLELALQATFGTHPFGASKKRLVIPSFNIGDNDVYVFRTPHVERLRRDYRVPAWQVAVATAAAPTFFPACRAVDNLRLVDGGVWANNPSLVALVEAVGPLDVPVQDVALLSVGTVAGFKGYTTTLDRAGKLGWAAHAAELILDATSTGVSNQTRFLLGDERYLRVNAIAAHDELSLDDVTSAGQLIPRARHASRKYMPGIASRFLSHRAAEYSPHHSV